MQKGKGHRDSLVRSVIVLALAFALPEGRCVAADSWERGMGRVSLPRWGHPVATDIPEGYMLAFVSAANPFSIPGLSESTASLVSVRRSHLAGIRWERTGIAGYSRDDLEVYCGLAFPGRIFNLAAIARADSRKVTGHGRCTDISARWSLALEVPRAAMVEIEACLPPGGASAHASLIAQGNETSFVLTIGRDERNGRVARAGGTLSATDRLMFLAGYDIVTGEVSGGLAVRADVVAAVSWSIHPVLGTTLSMTVGTVR
jgi:hypothetical protein